MIAPHPVAMFAALRARYRFLLLFAIIAFAGAARADDRPNILLIISDDQSWPHASAYGCQWVSTPGFDRVAASGVLFDCAIASTPGCSPTRASLLTGRHAWQIEHAGTHASYFPLKYPTFPEVLAGAGYWTGFTGKGWGPGDFRHDGRTANPAGPAFSNRKLKPPASGIASTDYAANFEDFLARRPDNVPFCFWMGGHEPHRAFEKGRGVRLGKSPGDVDVPGFLPDTPEIRDDLLDYAVEIEWFDSHIVRVLQLLEEHGELNNTLVIATSDNGMAFPRAKANLYEYGIHMPLAVSWPKQITGGRRTPMPTNFVDLTATIYEATGVDFPDDAPSLSGNSVLSVLSSDHEIPDDDSRQVVFAARERHSSSRYHSLGYPQRAIRSRTHLLIWNPKPERWPAGAPRKLEKKNGTFVSGREHGGYHDIDACPSLTFLIEQRDDPNIKPFFEASVALRPEYEFFDIRNDEACMQNLAPFDGLQRSPETTTLFESMRHQLVVQLQQTSDPRVSGHGDIFETYPRVSSTRFFERPEWAIRHPETVPEQEWLPKDTPQ